MKADIAVVFCDIGDVLVHTAPLMRSAAEAAARTCSDMGFNIDPQLFQECYLEVDKKTSRPHINHLFGDREVAMEATANLLNEPDIIYAGTFLTCYRDYIRQHIVPKEDITLFFKTLSEATSIKVGIISDGTIDEQLETLVRLRIAKYIDPKIVMISQAFGEEKTGTGIFLEALRRAGAKPQQAVMIGDNLDVDVKIPLSIGMKAIFFSKYVGLAPLSQHDVTPDATCASFSELLSVICPQIAQR